MRGGLEKAAEVGCAIIGGHTIRNPEPIYGLAVTGIVDPATNDDERQSAAGRSPRPDQTARHRHRHHRNQTRLRFAQLSRKKSSRSCRTVNSVGAELAERGLVRAATDITGFGLIGHLASMCRASDVSAVIDPARVPPISQEIVDLIERGCVPGGTEQNLIGANAVVEWDKRQRYSKSFDD